MPASEQGGPVRFFGVDPFEPAHQHHPTGTAGAESKGSLAISPVSAFIQFPAFGDNHAMLSPQTYSRSDIERWLGAAEVRKGQHYVDAVRALDVQAQSISAWVQGTAPHPYRVDIHFAPDRVGASYISAHCSCPLGGDCKHAAAVLLAGIEARAHAPRVNPALVAWFEALRQMQCTRAGKPKRAIQLPVLFYVLEWNIQSGACQVSLLKAKPGPDGRPGPAASQWNGIERALVQPPQFVSEEDVAILRLLWAQRGRDYYSDTLPLIGRHGDEILRRMLATGRALFDSDQHVPLKLGEARGASIVWQPDSMGRLRPQVHASPPAAAILALEPMWYLDPATRVAGPIELPFAQALARRLLSIPPITPREAPLVAAALRDLAPELPRPVDALETGLPVIDAPATPVLRLGTLEVYGMGQWRGYRYNYSHCPFDYAVPRLRYGEIELAFGDAGEFIARDDGQLVRVLRDAQAEAQFIKSLPSVGLQKVPAHLLYTDGSPLPAPLYGLNSETDWPGFVSQIVPQLRASGWRIEVPPQFRHSWLEVTSWQADIREDEQGWFELDMGIEVEGKRVPLAPLLAALFHRDARWLDGSKLAAISDEERITLVMPEGARIRVAAERLKPLARTLIDLFDAGSGPLRLSRLDAPRLAELAGCERWQFHGMEAVQALAERLRARQGVQPVKSPRGLALPLRAYQLEGLAWLQYLRECALSGLLADDMGLGKTAQTLAHLLLEKEVGRLDRPALIVLPTSLVSNWKREAARFAPSLSVLTLHGPARAGQFETIPTHDLVLTTYPLLWRDGEALAAYEYHLLILDEAQMVKNVASRGAGIVRKLRARHRLCLTGTPLENHLGELWAQFDFLLPGFLGDIKHFQQRWRTPIEKNGDTLRRELLARRIRPFILRRRKQDVAKELPAKSTIVRAVEIEGGQRDLYETVRSAMDEKVRAEIATKGFRRSQIIILDALLKLRQVCCDPRLVKTDGAMRVRERAKLALLMDMLPELVAEGRRVLLFSQFTSMLALIEEELLRHALDYVILTGDTRDRDTPIRRFQSGEVPLFLVSLKAGGVGLNLTAADTVIHYDPWWNPAVENQATDRAHRIGQTKRVFVYKLIVAGSIEEKILALQEKKAALAAGILSEDQLGEVKFSEADLAALLAPLPPLDTEDKNGTNPDQLKSRRLAGRTPSVPQEKGVSAYSSERSDRS